MNLIKVTVKKQTLKNYKESNKIPLKLNLDHNLTLFCLIRFNPSIQKSETYLNFNKSLCAVSSTWFPYLKQRYPYTPWLGCQSVRDEHFRYLLVLRTRKQHNPNWSSTSLVSLCLKPNMNVPPTKFYFSVNT